MHSTLKGPSRTRNKASKFGTVLEIWRHLGSMVIASLECEATERVDALVVCLNELSIACLCMMLDV